MSINIYTIGFTKTTAQRFFERMRISGLERIVDVRLNNKSQLAGFAKSEDLKYFAKNILNIDYVHMPGLAPTEDILSRYRKGEMSWREYEKRYIELIASRRVAERLDKKLINGSCLLCSEDTPHQCHRRLVCEYLDAEWGGVNAKHL